MYTLTIFTLVAIVLGIFLAILIPALRKQMRVVPGTRDRAAGFRRTPVTPPRAPASSEPRETDRTRP